MLSVIISSSELPFHYKSRTDITYSNPLLFPLQRMLTLICAPAGIGKTTLISEWLAGSKRPITWLLLDEGDNDPTRFLTYLVAAL